MSSDVGEGAGDAHLFSKTETSRTSSACIRVDVQNAVGSGFPLGHAEEADGDGDPEEPGELADGFLL